MVVRSKEKETKEEKTQSKKLEEDLFPNLYSELNLSQFVNEDETVRTRNPGEVVEGF